MVRGAGRFDGEEFRRRRVTAGLSQQRVAELVNATRWQVIAYEQGRATPEPARLAALAAAVSCPPAVLTGAAAATPDLAGLRRLAGMTRLQAAARLGALLGARVPASKWLLEQTENGEVPVAWRFTARRTDIIAAMAQAYGQPVDVVNRAWPAVLVTKAAEDLPATPSPVTTPKTEPAAQPAGSAGNVDPPGRRSKAHTAWQALNDRQRLYLRAAFDDDQRAERDARSNAGRATFVAKPKADTWRWRDFSIKHPLADKTAIQSTLKDAGIHDPGAGSSLAALERRGLLLVRHDMRYIPLLGNVIVVQVRMTTAGRAAVRAGLGATAPRKTPKGLLSSWLFKQFAKVAAAEPEGLASYELWGEAHVYLGVGYHNGRNPSRGYIAQHRPGPGAIDSRWHLTDDGRAHLAEHLPTYRQLYPGIPTDAINLPEPHSAL